MRSLTIIFCAVLLVFCFHQAQARIIHVPAEQTTIQAGINASVSGDTVLVARGRYHERIDFASKAILVASNFIFDSDTITIDSTIIDGGSIGTVVTFSSSEDSSSIVQGFTIENGNAYKGGGIYCNGSSPTIVNNIIKGNHSSRYGGGICCDFSHPTIVENGIIGNSADENGGGIYCYYSSPKIHNNLFSSDSAVYFGGGIYCTDYSFAKITNNTIINTTKEAVFAHQSSPVIKNNIIANTPHIAIWIRYYSAAIITNNTISGTGNGIYCWEYSSATISNNIITNTSGMGIYCLENASPTINNNTLTDNSGDGIRCFRSSPAINNNIIANSLNGGGIVCEDESSNPTISYCDTWNNATGNYYGCTPGEGCISADPLFCDPSSDNYYLNRVSPCLGSGQGGVNMGALDIGCGFVIVAPGDDKGGHANSQVPVLFYIEFIGDSTDTFDLNISDKLGWTIQPTHYQIVLDSGQVDTVDFTVSIPSTPFGTIDSVRLDAISKTDSTSYNWAYLTVTCNAYNITIIDISDIGNDQGKQVRIDWSSFPGNDSLVTHFTIFRRIDSLLFSALEVKPEIFSSKDYPPGSWEMIETFPAYGETLYSVVVPTLKDSTIAEGMYWSVFFVRAGTNNPTVYFDSPVDSGYSLDNLSPSPPTGLFASHQRAITKLTWKTTSAPDFDYYTIYRDTLSGFVPSLSNRLGFTIDTTFADSNAQLGRAFYYLASATDFSGNESNPSNEAMGVRYLTGDANADGQINSADVSYLINYLFVGGPAPQLWQAGDANCDGTINSADVVYLINYLFVGGPPPCE